MIDKDKFESETIANFLNRIVNNVEIYLTNDEAKEDYYILNILKYNLLCCIDPCHLHPPNLFYAAVVRYAATMVPRPTIAALKHRVLYIIF